MAHPAWTRKARAKRQATIEARRNNAKKKSGSAEIPLDVIPVRTPTLPRTSPKTSSPTVAQLQEENRLLRALLKRVL